MPHKTHPLEPRPNSWTVVPMEETWCNLPHLSLHGTQADRPWQQLEESRDNGSSDCNSLTDRNSLDKNGGGDRNRSPLVHPNETALSIQESLHSHSEIYGHGSENGSKETNTNTLVPSRPPTLSEDSSQTQDVQLGCYGRRGGGGVTFQVTY